MAYSIDFIKRAVAYKQETWVNMKRYLRNYLQSFQSVVPAIYGYFYLSKC